MNMEYYVYQARGLNGVLLYIGQGCGHRYRHCNSGISSCLELNRYFFEHGADAIKVNILSYFLTKEEALLYEKSCIKKLKPKFNREVLKHISDDMTIIELLRNGYKVDFRTVSEFYWDNHNSENPDILAEIKELAPEFGEIVDAIGIEEIKSTSFHKTKSKAKYRKIVGVEAVSSSKSKAYKNLRVKEGGFYTYSELREKLQACFDKFNIKTKAKATDIKQIFNVKRTTRNGVEGYLIGEKI